MRRSLLLRIADLGRLWRVLPTPVKESEVAELAPFNAALEDGAARRFVFRRRGESDISVANRWALAICELQEELANENAALELELHTALAFSRGETPCGS